jgi:flavodoxin
MKRIALIIVLIVLAAIVIKGPDSLIGLAKMSRSADTKNSLPNITGQAVGVTGKKVLVAYFSWGGNTRSVAKLIHDKTGGDFFEIKKETPYPGDYKGAVDVGKQEKEQNMRPKLAGPLPDLKQYDVILIGYPIWWYIEPMPVKTFVEAQDLSGKIILPFATSGGSDIIASVADLRKTLPKAQVKDGLLANLTGGIDGWLKENGLVK